MKTQNIDAKLLKHQRMVRLAIWLAVLVSAFLIVVKVLAWSLSGSIALLGSLLDSLFDFFVSLVNFWAVRHAMTPADKEHRYGHGKVESLAALAQSVIISVSAGYLLFEATRHAIQPQDIAYSEIAIVVMCLSIVLTLGLVFFQHRVVRTANSVAIAADSAHYQGDLYMNLGVIAALIMAGVFGWRYADPIMGGIVAVILFYNAWKIAATAVNQLMDRELEDNVREEIKHIVLSHPAVQNIHDLRTRRSGMQSFAQCHIELDGTLTLKEAHDISDEVEMLVVKAFPQLEIIIHQDPEGEETLSNLEKT